MAIEEKNERINGLNVHYWDAGFTNGRPVVLLHGGFGDARSNWWEILQALGQEFQVLAPDLPGYGGSDALKQMDIDGLLEWLDAFIKHTGLQQTVLVGSSFGGLVARIYAASYPDRIPALVLVNGGVIPSIPGFGRMIAGVPGLGGFLFKRFATNSTSKKNLKDIFHDSNLLTEEFTEVVQANRAGLAGMMRGMTLSDFPAERRKPLIPVLLMWGENDTISPLVAAQHIQKNIPGAQLAEVAECGHLPHLEVPEVFAAQVSLFLNNLDRKQRDLPGVGPLIGGL